MEADKGGLNRRRRATIPSSATRSSGTSASRSQISPPSPAPAPAPCLSLVLRLSLLVSPPSSLPVPVFLPPPPSIHRRAFPRLLLLYHLPRSRAATR
eukprot:379870-Rhodomonas_salina.1